MLKCSFQFDAHFDWEEPATRIFESPMGNNVELWHMPFPSGQSYNLYINQITDVKSNLSQSVKLNINFL